MMMITSFANPRMAQAFVDYMATQGVILEIQHHETSDIWLADASQTQLVRAELSYFLAHPDDPRYARASWSTGNTHSGLSYPRISLASLRRNTGPLTFGVTIISLVLWLIITFTGATVANLLFWPYAPGMDFQVWRYVSHALLHFTFWHFTFNLLWWWYLGGKIEKHLGSGKLFTLLIIASLLSGFMMAKFHSPVFGGLSGAVYALFGYVAIRGEVGRDSHINMPRGLILMQGVILTLEVINSYSSLYAHFTGLLVGVAMALMDMLNVRKRT